MKPENWIALGSATLTACLTGFGLYWGPKLAVTRSLEQFRSQKVWEKRQEAYSRILDDLALVYAHYVALIDKITSGIPYDPADEAMAGLKAAQCRLELASITGAHIISEGTAKALDDYRKSMYAAQSKREMYERCDIMCDAAKACIEVVKKEAAYLWVFRFTPRSTFASPQPTRIASMEPAG